MIVFSRTMEVFSILRGNVILQDGALLCIIPHTVWPGTIFLLSIYYRLSEHSVEVTLGITIPENRKGYAHYFDEGLLLTSKWRGHERGLKKRKGEGQLPISLLSLEVKLM